MIIDEANEVIEELFKSLLHRYQNNLEKSMKGGEFFFHCVHLLHYKCHKTNLDRDGLHIDSTDWIKNKKAAINLLNKKDNKCFQYAVTVVLNHEEIKEDPQRVAKFKLFINKYNWGE